MAKAKVKFGGRKGAVMPGVTLSSLSAGLQLVPVDAAGAPVTISDPSTVTTTLVSDNSAFVITAGADSLHYTAAIPAGTTGLANVTATLTFNSGAPAPVSASIPITLDTPSAAVDLQILIS